MNKTKLGFLVSLFSVLSVSVSASFAAFSVYNRYQERKTEQSITREVVVMDVHGEDVYLMDTENKRLGVFTINSCGTSVIRMAIGSAYEVPLILSNKIGGTVRVDFAGLCSELLRDSLNNSFDLFPKTINRNNV